MSVLVRTRTAVDGEMHEIVAEVSEMQLMQDDEENAVVLLVDYEASCCGAAIDITKLERSDLEAAVERAIEGICS